MPAKLFHQPLPHICYSTVSSHLMIDEALLFIYAENDAMEVKRTCFEVTGGL